MSEKIQDSRYKGDIDKNQVSEITSAKCLDSFLAAVLIWINKPHVTNRRLVGTQLLSVFPWRYPDTDDEVQEFLEDMSRKFGDDATAVLSPGEQKADDDSDSDEQQPVEIETHTPGHSKRGVSKSPQTDITIEDLKSLSTSSTCRLLVIVRDLLPRQLNQSTSLREVITFDQQRKQFKFYPLALFNNLGQKSSTENEIFYSFTFNDEEEPKRIVLDVSKTQKTESMSTMSFQWLQEHLLVKLSRWAGEDNLRTQATSLRTVSVDAYHRLYNELKTKYGPDLIEKWSEKTDPQKFVYEDISIATFLLLIWEKEQLECGCSKQSFVDLGCGNGLLVYLLTSEGHPGLGIDIQKRKIWDLYGSNTKLEVKALMPSAENLFPEYDWIIGNHSDELTPWIPVIAARSSYQTRYFVLPCCFHDFDQKFSQKDHGLSQYRTYLNYIRDIGKVCGFEVEEDVLRIPSTKRVCFLGRKRTYSATDEPELDKRRSDFINGRCKKQKLENSSSTSSNSHPRPFQTGKLDESNNSECSTETKTLDISELWTSGFQPRIPQKNFRDV